jgi:hypothetical protein
MTTARFNSMAGPTAQAMAAVHALHPKPPEQLVRASIRCTRCRGLLTYSVSPIGGRTTGRCSSAGCLNWSEL